MRKSRNLPKLKSFFDIKDRSKNFDVKQIFSRNDQFDNLLILLLLKFKNYEIVIHVFHDRGSFLWIGAKEVSNTNLQWFNDVPRAMQK